MDSWTTSVGRALGQAHTRALPISSLRRRLAETGEAETGETGWFLARLKDEPSVFRVIADRLGPWSGAVDMAASRGRGESFPEPAMPGTDPWILALLDVPCGQGSDTTVTVAEKIREGLRAWGMTLDEGSPAAVARWIGAVKEAERTLDVAFRQLRAGCGTSPSTNPPPRPPPRERTPVRWRSPRPPPPGRSESRSRQATLPAVSSRTKP